MAENQKIAQFQMITGVDEQTARTWLSQSSWTVDLAVDRYFHSGATAPATLTPPKISIDSGPSPQEILRQEVQKKKLKQEIEERLLSRCLLKYRKPKQPLERTSSSLPPDEMVPLKGITVNVSVNHLVADVVVSQRYFNIHDEPMEAFFTFRQDNASLYHFEADINGRNLIGVCKEKERAFDKYDNAISSGHGAFLVEQGETSDSFKMSVGNLPPKKECVITMKYVTELETEGEALRFILPITRMSFAVDSDDDSSSDLAAKVPSGFRMKMNLEMSSAITGVQCQTHHIATELEGSQAAVVFQDDPYEKERKEMILLIGLAQPHQPSCILERDTTENSANSSSSSSTSRDTSTDLTRMDALMVTLYPKIEVDENPRTELIMLVDQSGSMAGARITQAKNALQLFLRSLSEGTKFNIIGFGTKFNQLFPQSQDYTQDTLSQATYFVTKMSANLGGTDVLTPLSHIFSKTAALGNRQILLITDGEIRNTSAVLDLVRRNAKQTRVFTFGIGGECSLTLVKGVAQAARGHYEFVNSDERIETKVLRTLKHVMQPILADVAVDWGTLPVVGQTPEVLPPVFSGEKLLVYGFIDPAAPLPKDTHVVVTGHTETQKFHFEAKIPEAPTCNGQTVHRLAVRSLIRDSEGDQDETTAQKKVVPLATKYGLVSKFTSIVAIDKRNDQVEGSGAMKTVDIDQKAVDIQADQNSRQRNSKIAEIQKQIDEVKYIMSQNIEMVLDRSETLDCIREQSDLLEEKAQLFQKNAQGLSQEGGSGFGSFFSGLSSMVPDPWSWVNHAGLMAKEKKEEEEKQEKKINIPEPVHLSADITKKKKSSFLSSWFSGGETEGETDTLAPAQTATAPVRQSSAQPSSQNPYDMIILLQNANGSWDNINLLLKAIPTLSKSQIETAAQKEQVTLDSSLTLTFVTTALAVTVLEKKFASQKEQWELLAEKARKWLHREAQKASIDLEKIWALVRAFQF